MDCLPISSVYCVPAAYDEVWTPGGLTVRVNADRTVHVVSEAAFARAGARIAFLHGDAFFASSMAGWDFTDVGEMRLYYRASCDAALTCTFSVATWPIERHDIALSRGPTVMPVSITGADQEGLDIAMRTISVIVNSGACEELVPLATLWTKKERASRPGR